MTSLPYFYDNFGWFFSLLVAYQLWKTYKISRIRLSDTARVTTYRFASLGATSASLEPWSPSHTPASPLFWTIVWEKKFVPRLGLIIVDLTYSFENHFLLRDLVYVKDRRLSRLLPTTLQLHSLMQELNRIISPRSFLLAGSSSLLLVRLLMHFRSVFVSNLF